MTALTVQDSGPAGPPILADVGLASQPEWIAAIACAWAGTGLLIAVGQARRGHDVRPLAALGLVLGPLLYGYVRSSLHGYEDATAPVVIREGTDCGGRLRVLVAITGEPGGVVVALPVLRLVAPDIARVEVAGHVTYEAARGSATLAREAAAHQLESAGLFLHEFGPGLVLVPGRGLDVVHRYAVDEAVDLLLVVGDEVHGDLDGESSDRSMPIAVYVTGRRPLELSFPI